MSIDSTVLIAIIGVGGTLLGTLLGTLVPLLGAHKRRKHELALKREDWTREDGLKARSELRDLYVSIVRSVDELYVHHGTAADLDKQRENMREGESLHDDFVQQLDDAKVRRNATVKTVMQYKAQLVYLAPEDVRIAFSTLVNAITDGKDLDVFKEAFKGFADASRAHLGRVEAALQSQPSD